MAKIYMWLPILLPGTKPGVQTTPRFMPNLACLFFISPSMSTGVSTSDMRDVRLHFNNELRHNPPRGQNDAADLATMYVPFILPQPPRSRGRGAGESFATVGHPVSRPLRILLSWVARRSRDRASALGHVDRSVSRLQRTRSEDGVQSCISSGITA